MGDIYNILWKNVDAKDIIIVVRKVLVFFYAKVSVEAKFTSVFLFTDFILSI